MHDQSTTPIEVVESRDQRDHLAGRTEVLDKVKALELLPGDTYATTELVAAFYGVDRRAIEKLIERNRAELNEDGYRILRGQELSDILSESGMNPRTPSLSVLPRRAILRVGMLLRDSEVAKQVRGYLLDSEEAPGGFVVPKNMPEALRLAADLSERTELAEAQVRELTPKAEAHDSYMVAEGCRLVREVAKLLGLKEKDLRGFLLSEKLVFPQQSLCGRMQYDAYAEYVGRHFVLTEHLVQHNFGTCSHYTLNVTNSGVELIRRRLEAHRRAIAGETS